MHALALVPLLGTAIIADISMNYTNTATHRKRQIIAPGGCRVAQRVWTHIVATLISLEQYVGDASLSEVMAVGTCHCVRAHELGECILEKAAITTSSLITVITVSPSLTLMASRFP